MKTLTIARFTIQEAISRRLILAGLVISLGFIGLFTLGFVFAHDRATQELGTSLAARADNALAFSILLLLGLYAVYFLTGFLALFLSVGTVSGEVDSGTLHAVLARPLRRSEYLLGRWLGHAAMLLAYVTLMAGALLLIARSVAGVEPLAPAAGMAIMALGALTLLSLSLLGSSLFSTLANGVVVFTLFGVAWLGGFIEFVGGLLDNLAMLNMGTAISLVVPSDGLWRAASFYFQSPLVLALGSSAEVPFFSAAQPAVPFLVWSAAYVVVLLAGALAVFSRRDL